MSLRKSSALVAPRWRQRSYHPAQAQSDQADLKAFAVHINHTPQQPWPGYGVYLGNGLILTAAHVAGDVAQTKPHVVIAGQDLPPRSSNKAASPTLRASTDAVNKPAADPPMTAMLWLLAREVGLGTLRASRGWNAIVCFYELPHEPAKYRVLDVRDRESVPVSRAWHNLVQLPKSKRPQIRTRIILQRWSVAKEKGTRKN